MVLLSQLQICHCPLAMAAPSYGGPAPFITGRQHGLLCRSHVLEVSACLSHSAIVSKRCKLGSPNLYCHGSPRLGGSEHERRREIALSIIKSPYLRNGVR